MRHPHAHHGAGGIPGPFELIGRALHALLTHAKSPAAVAGLLALMALSVLVIGCRARIASRRRVQRLRVVSYRGDDPTVPQMLAFYNGLHGALRVEGWRRLVTGQPAVAIETALVGGGRAPAQVRNLIVCPVEYVASLRAVLAAAQPNVRLVEERGPAGVPYVLRLRKRRSFLSPLPIPEGPEFDDRPVVRLMASMQAAGRPALVQLSLTPASIAVERWVRWRLSKADRPPRPGFELRGRQSRPVIPRSQLRDHQVRSALDAASRSLFCLDVRVVAEDRSTCRLLAGELSSWRGENHLAARRGRRARLPHKRLRRLILTGQGQAVPDPEHQLLTSGELAGLWQFPGPGTAGIRLVRSQVPHLPPPPGVCRPLGRGLLASEDGPVTIHAELRRQNTAVTGTVEQGKSSYLAATIAEDLTRDRCAVVVLDPKGDASDAALSLVPEERAVTLLDFAAPTCGFNPLAIDAEPAAIADSVVEALKDVFDDGDIRASSDRYIRSAVTAVCVAEPEPSLWHAARLLVPAHRAYREAVTNRLRQRPEYREIAMFFADEIDAQLRDARSLTVAKLEAPVNKLQRFINPPAIKRILLNDTLTVDFDRIIANREVLVVRGGLGAIGTGNTSALMQLLVAMLDASLSRQQDRVAEEDRISVALKIDEAPQIINAGFASTMALKRSAGLETVACWQSDAQWTDADVRAQLDALFAHRVMFATASAADARSGADLLMGRYVDSFAAGPDARRAANIPPDVRLHLPRHTALVSWTSPAGRLPPFLARTIPLQVDQKRIRVHAEQQSRRGGRALAEHELQSRSALEPDGSSEIPVPAVGEAAPPALPSPAADDGVQLSLEVSAMSVPAPPHQVKLAQSDRAVALGELRGSRVPDSYAELLVIADCPTVRHSPERDVGRQPAPGQLDLQILSLLAELRFVLQNQVARRFFEGRIRSAQRELKRLADAGWVDHFEFRPNSGGRGPRCYQVTERGLAILRRFRGTPGLHVPEDRLTAPELNDVGGRLARHDVRAGAWMLAAEEHLGPAVGSLRGPRAALALPPRVTERGVKRFLGPAELRLAGDWFAADFVTTDVRRRLRRNVEQFEPLEPDGRVELRLAHRGSLATLDLLLELDATDEPQKQVSKLERYDHFLTGWALEKRRHQEQGQPPVVAFVCRDEPLARRFCEAADALLVAHRAEWGAGTSTASYAGRERIFFCTEMDMHQGELSAYRVPTLPPQVRAESGEGRQFAPEQVQIIDRRLLASGTSAPHISE